MAFRKNLANRCAGQLSRHNLFRGFVFLIVFGFAVAVHAQAPDMVKSPVDRSDRTTLRGHHPSWANGQNEIGPVSADLPLESLTIVLARPANRQQAFDQFVKDQQNPASPDFHHWLTPAEIGQRFGVSSHDIAAIKSWLESEGLHLDSVASSLTRIRFSGNAAAVSSAFGAEMRYYQVNDEKRIAISSDPQIPSALAAIIQSVTGLYNVKIRPLHRVSAPQVVQNQTTAQTNASASPDGNFTCSGSPCNFVLPGDFAVIYNLNPVYANNIHGEGQSIAIVGRANVNPADITNFQMRAGLAQVAPITIVPPNGVAPPPAATTTKPSGDQFEATLDVTRAGSVATGATIKLIVSADSATVSGLDVATEFAIDTTPLPAQIMSISFGSCEQGNAAGVHFWDNLFQQAAAEGISVFVSSGDGGAAECDNQFTTPPATQIASPNDICSSSFSTCVGGTEFADTTNPSMFWGASNGSGLSSALSYIPEGAWNEPTTSSGSFQIAATGGGVSTVIPTPSYQTGVGVPVPSTGRYTPDISFSSSLHDGYFACVAASGSSCVGTSSFSFTVFGGTSAAAPSMAGIAALLNQSAGGAQGNLNPMLYQLAANTSLNVFNDVTPASSGVSNCDVGTPSMCNNSLPGPSSLTGGLAGFSVGTGFDLATGLGSINVANLLANWKASTVVTGDFTISSPTQTQTIAAGQSANFAIALTTQGAALSSAVTFSASNLPTNATASFSPTSIGAGATSGSTTLTISTTAHTALLPPAFRPPTTIRPVTPVVLVSLLALSILLFERRWLAAHSGFRPVAIRVMPTLLLLLCAGLISGCGVTGGNATPASGGGPATGTPAGTYTITVTATSGSTVHSTTVSLVVQ
jgi:pseudomonalisin